MNVWQQNSKYISKMQNVKLFIYIFIFCKQIKIRKYDLLYTTFENEKVYKLF